MFVVVLHRMPPPDDTSARALAEALAITPVEARGRLSVPGGGPAIAARRADSSAAEALVARLSAAGFPAFALDADRVETDIRRTVVRRFNFGASEVGVETRAGESRSVPYADFRFVARATGISSETTSKTVEGRQFSAGRALVSGGLMLTKAKSTTTRETQETWEGWLLIYPADAPALVFRESGTLWDGLGAALQPTRQANFTQLCTWVRARNAAAPFDDRLMRRAGQSQLLGPGLEPESNLDLALAILFATPR